MDQKVIKETSIIKRQYTKFYLIDLDLPSDPIKYYSDLNIAFIDLFNTKGSIEKDRAIVGIVQNFEDTDLLYFTTDKD